MAELIGTDNLGFALSLYTLYLDLELSKYLILMRPMSIARC